MYDLMGLGWSAVVPAISDVPDSKVRPGGEHGIVTSEGGGLEIQAEVFAVQAAASIDTQGSVEIPAALELSAVE